MSPVTVNQSRPGVLQVTGVSAQSRKFRASMLRGMSSEYPCLRYTGLEHHWIAHYWPTVGTGRALGYKLTGSVQSDRLNMNS